MELDILLRGQSNAYLLVGDEFAGVGAATLISEVQRLLGFDGRADTIHLAADWYTPGIETIYGGTAFIGDWVRRGGDGAWQPLSHEQDLLNYIAQNPHPQTTETAVVWLHSEYDSLNGGLSQAEWESAVRADAAWTRAGLGQDVAHSPYVFVSAIPFAGADDRTTQAIRAGMEDLSADPAFHARVGAQADDIDMSFKFPSESDNTQAYGNAHMSEADTVQTAQRLARSIADEWADYARPGSPVAQAGGHLDAAGPEVTAASLTAPDTLLVTVRQDGAGGFGALDPDAARGLGWTVRGAGGTIAADHAEVVSADTLLLHFGAVLPAGGLLFYGYGHDRIADYNQPGEGNAIYDDQGLPVWTPASGVAIGDGAASGTPVQITVGTGSDSLVLRISEDAYAGDAQYTVTVDGVRIGGVLTAQAAHGSGTSDEVTVRGDWGIGGHQAVVSFLNDAYGGPGADRNLHVDGAGYDGVAVAGAAHDLLSAGDAAFGFQDATSVPSGAAITVGSGSDSLVLRISQDAYAGDAQYTVRVDGVQVGGVLTAQAAHGSGTSDAVTVRGDWGIGGHQAVVSFLNDAYGGPGADRNLHVDGASYDGAAVAGAAHDLLSAGDAAFGFQDATAVPGGAAITVGSGSDSLVLRISEDAYAGDAQYAVRVDGVQIGGVLTAQAAHGSGVSDAVTVRGDWGSGGHAVSVEFLNDAYGGAGPGLDRNLYLEGASYDGAAVAGASGSLFSPGAVSFGVEDATPLPAGGGTVALGSGPDRLAVLISQDAYAGDAQYTVRVDGVQIGGTQTAKALHGAGQEDSLTVSGNWAPGDHGLAITFLNDAWDGASLDRNLYVDGASYQGQALAGAVQPLFSEGTVTIGFHDSSPIG